MALKTNKLAAATAIAAAFSLLAPPAAALDLPRPAAAEAYDGDALNAERHRRWRRDRNIDTGDVVAGVLVIGAIAAIAGAAGNRRDRYERRYPDEDYGYRGADRYDRYDRTDSRDSRGIERAVDMCVDEVERGRDRVGSVDSATRSADGWRVSGALESGAGYACTIGNDGRSIDVDLGSYGYGSAPAEAVADGQYEDDYYARARESQRSAEPYLGDDGRYEAARAPDFE